MDKFGARECAYKMFEKSMAKAGFAAVSGAAPAAGSSWRFCLRNGMMNSLALEEDRKFVRAVR